MTQPQDDRAVGGVIQLRDDRREPQVEHPRVAQLQPKTDFRRHSSNTAFRRQLDEDVAQHETGEQAHGKVEGESAEPYVLAFQRLAAQFAAETIAQIAVKAEAPERSGCEPFQCICELVSSQLPARRDENVGARTASPGSVGVSWLRLYSR